MYADGVVCLHVYMCVFVPFCNCIQGYYSTYIYLYIELELAHTHIHNMAKKKKFGNFPWKKIRKIFLDCSCLCTVKYHPIW